MRALKNDILSLLRSEDFFQRRDELCSWPGRKTVNPLFSFFLHRDEKIRWRAVTAMGVVVACLAEKDIESARVVMRRLMWSLNDESGGIGWGAPEAMGEIIALDERLASEYGAVLISYIWEEGNYLEYELLQRGALWGVGRAAQVRPLVMKNAEPYLVPFLHAPDATLRGLSARALGLLRSKMARKELAMLLNDTGAFSLYEDGDIQHPMVRDMAQYALSI